MENSTMMSGFLIIDKPAGFTSHDVVNIVRRASGQKRVGHTGTLDPFATGVLLVTLGHATRLGEYTNSLPKTYTAEISLGATSDTDDITGEISSKLVSNKPVISDVTATLKEYIGTIEQVPPSYAAIKVKGKKLYEYARAGKEVERKPRRVIIHDIQLLSYDFPNLKILVTCGSGTYIRALARDIGESLGTGAYLTALRRDAIGEFTINEATTIEDITAENMGQFIKPLERLVEHFPSLILNNEDAVKFKQGREVPLKELPGAINFPPKVGEVAIFDSQKYLLGIGRLTPPSTLAPIKVFLKP